MNDAAFTGSVAEIYDRYLVPMLFDPYAGDLATRVAIRSVGNVLELACGTGAVTRRLADALPRSVEIVATDLNQTMLDRAAARGTRRPVQWRQADVMQLPFDAASFDVVVCQFGVMFFPDRAKAHAEVLRVLRPHGVYLFNVWDRIEENELSYEVARSVAALFPEDPPDFLARTPYGYFQTSAINRDLRAGGFAHTPRIETFAARSIAESSEIAAMAICQGTPLRGEIEARDPSRLAEVTRAADEAIQRRFGAGPIDAQMQAHVIVATT